MFIARWIRTCEVVTTVLSASFQWVLGAKIIFVFFVLLWYPWIFCFCPGPKWPWVTVEGANSDKQNI
jgi:hypothetical protein